MSHTTGNKTQLDKGETRKKTRDRILEMGRELFNERGQGNVTLAHIAEQLSISEGNVWYHFHTKHDLTMALFEELKEQIRLNQDSVFVDANQENPFDALLKREFQLLWKYRFLFRDQINWASDQQEVQKQLVAIVVQGQTFIEQVLQRIHQATIIEIVESDIPKLARNIWIIGRYWIDYCQIRSEQKQITEEEVNEGVEQVRTMVYPYLTEFGKDMLAARSKQRQ